MHAVLFLLAILAPAAPIANRTPIASRAPAIVAAEQAWAAAVAERDAAKAVPLWEAAARAFETAAAGKHREAAHAAVLAWQTAIALAKPTRVMTAREQGLVAALAVYAPLAPAAARPALHFARASTWLRHDQRDRAIPILQMVVLAHPTSSVAEDAANHLLDTYNLQQNFVALREWTIKMRASPALVAKRPELANTLAHLHVQFLHREALAAQQAGEHRRCGTIFRDAARIAQRNDALLYNAGVCFELAGDTAAALQAFSAVAKQNTALSADAKKRVNALTSARRASGR